MKETFTEIEDFVANLRHRGIYFRRHKDLENVPYFLSDCGELVEINPDGPFHRVLLVNGREMTKKQFLRHFSIELLSDKKSDE